MFHIIANINLPFKDCSPFSISQQFLTGKNILIEKLENNNFTKDMLKYVNEISKDNYKCKYYDADNINVLVNSHHNQALKVMHLNCSSIAKNGIDLSSYLAHLNLKFDIIMLTETRQTTVGIVEFYFPNYDIFLDNPDSSKGGACVLVRKNMFQNVKLVLDNSTNLKNKCNCAHCEIENVWVSLEFNKKQVLIGCIYRHPKAESGISHFNEYFNTALNSINDNIITIIAGDFNINLLNTENALVEQYTNNALQNSFIPCITIPTRVTYHSASIIDHILLKTPKHLIHTKVSAGNLVTDISDHIPNLLFIDLLVQTPKYRPMVRVQSKYE